jgi:hypothetical protein
VTLGFQVADHGLDGGASEGRACVHATEGCACKSQALAISNRLDRRLDQQRKKARWLALAFFVSSFFQLDGSVLWSDYCDSSAIIIQQKLKSGESRNFHPMRHGKYLMFARQTPGIKKGVRDYRLKCHFTARAVGQHMIARKLSLCPRIPE